MLRRHSRLRPILSLHGSLRSRLPTSFRSGVVEMNSQRSCLFPSPWLHGSLRSRLPSALGKACDYHRLTHTGLPAQTLSYEVQYIFAPLPVAKVISLCGRAVESYLPTPCHLTHALHEGFPREYICAAYESSSERNKSTERGQQA